LTVYVCPNVSFTDLKHCCILAVLSVMSFRICTCQQVACFTFSRASKC